MDIDNKNNGNKVEFEDFKPRPYQVMRGQN